jgi:hypothetical protein
MSRLMGMVCAGALLSAAGCTLESFSLTSFWKSPQDEQHLSGSPDEVSRQAASALEQMNIAVVSTRSGETVRLAGQTKNGQRFALVFERRKGDGEPWTVMHLEWEKEADTRFWGELIDGVVSLRLSQRGPRS